MSSSLMYRAPGMWPTSYSAFWPTCRRTRFGSFRFLASHSVETTTGATGATYICAGVTRGAATTAHDRAAPTTWRERNREGCMGSPEVCTLDVVSSVDT